MLFDDIFKEFYLLFTVVQLVSGIGLYLMFKTFDCIVADFKRIKLERKEENNGY